METWWKYGGLLDTCIWLGTRAVTSMRRTCPWILQKMGGFIWSSSLDLFDQCHKYQLNIFLFEKEVTLGISTEYCREVFTENGENKIHFMVYITDIKQLEVRPKINKSKTKEYYVRHMLIEFISTEKRYNIYYYISIMAVHQAGINMTPPWYLFIGATKENTHKHINKLTHWFGYSQWDPVFYWTRWCDITLACEIIDQAYALLVIKIKGCQESIPLT